jgi:hypothetical protein
LKRGKRKTHVITPILSIAAILSIVEPANPGYRWFKKGNRLIKEVET